MTGAEQMNLFFLILCYVFPVALSLWVGILSLYFTNFNYRELVEEVKKSKRGRQFSFRHVIIAVFSLIAAMSFAVAVFFVLLLFRAMIV